MRDERYDGERLLKNTDVGLLNAKMHRYVG